MSERYEFIEVKKGNYPIVKMCIWLDVSASGFYEWRDRPPSISARRRDRLAGLIQAIFDESDATYGYRRVHAALTRQGEDCGPELVRDIMRELGLVPCQPRPWHPRTTQAAPGAEALPDLVNRDFTANAPGTKMVGDITYLRTWEGFSYLATVIDCCTKECIGYAIADHMRAELVIDAIRMAARNRTLEPDAVFHTDHGSQGGFNRWSQHLDGGGVWSWEIKSRDRMRQLVGGGSGRRIGRCGLRCGRRDGRSRRVRCSGRFGV